MHCCDDCSASRVSPLLPSRRSMIIGLTSAAVLSASRATAAAGGSADDERFMRLALDEAQRGDYPFGAVIVRDGKVIARGRNLGKTDGDPTAHGEMVAIRRCLADHGRAALQGSTLYTSGEPCAMCMGAIIWCHMGRLVFAASVEQLATKIDQIFLNLLKSLPRRRSPRLPSPEAYSQTKPCSFLRNSYFRTPGARASYAPDTPGQTGAADRCSA